MIAETCSACKLCMHDVSSGATASKKRRVHLNCKFNKLTFLKYRDLHIKFYMQICAKIPNPLDKHKTQLDRIMQAN